MSIKADAAKNAMFSTHGDSGSAIVDDNGFVVALLFAGAGAGTVGNPIAAVLSELNITMCVGKQFIKDKEIHKDLVKDKDKDKDKDLHKDLAKDKEIHKDLVKNKDKDKDKDLIKDKEIHKDLVKDNAIDGKPLKDIGDSPQKRIGDNLPGPGPIERNPRFPRSSAAGNPSALRCPPHRLGGTARGAEEFHRRRSATGPPFRCLFR